MVLIGPESVAIGSDRSVRVEKQSVKERLPGRDGGRWVGIAVTKRQSNFRFVRHTTWQGGRASSTSKTSSKVSRAWPKTSIQAPVANTLSMTQEAATLAGQTI
jgi:hypothetical protein